MDLNRIKFWPPTPCPTLKLGFLKSSTSSFAYHVAFELRERSEHVEHHLSGWPGSVYRLSDGAKVSPSELHFVQYLYEVFQRPRQPVQLPDYQRVILAELIEKPVKFWSFPPRSRSRFMEELLAAYRRQFPDLGGRVLPV